MRLTWELKAVNAKDLDTQLHLAPPFDTIEREARKDIIETAAQKVHLFSFVKVRENWGKSLILHAASQIYKVRMLPASRVWQLLAAQSRN